MRHGCQHGRKAELNWKLKISNMAGNADITQLQAHDAKHRQMHQVNSLQYDTIPYFNVCSKADVMASLM